MRLDVLHHAHQATLGACQYQTFLVNGVVCDDFYRTYGWYFLVLFEWYSEKPDDGQQARPLCAFCAYYVLVCYDDLVFGYERGI